jgi:hypothetical protein
MCNKVKKLPLWRGIAPSSPSSFQAALWEIRRTSRQNDLGMYALKDIKRGELVISEQPVHLSKLRLWHRADYNSRNGTFFRIALTNLSESSRCSILSLKNSFESENGREYDKIVGIYHTNYLTVDLSDLAEAGESYVALFPTISRANHSCSPSVHFFFDSSTFRGELRALRDLPKGSELTIWYENPLQPREKRRKRLQEVYGFVCQCEACDRATEEVAASDARRRVLTDFRTEEVTPNIPDSWTYDHLKTLLQYANVEKQEALRPYIFNALYAFAMYKLGNLQDAAKWRIQLLGEWRAIEGGKNPTVRAEKEV